MNILIIGWYGTETIGDRAILAGFLRVIVSICDDVNIKVGSIYPFFTQRTLLEDCDFYNQIAGKEINIELFDSRNHFTLRKEIDNSDCVFVGGGPLMDVSWMYMIEYAFEHAKKKNKKTGLIGCGIGPLYKKQYKKSCRNILCHSDLNIFRDDFSADYARELAAGKETSMFSLIDPAAICANVFENIDTFESKPYIAINLREFPNEYLTSSSKLVEERIKYVIATINDLALKNNQATYLVPMHYFGIGGDDREFLNRIMIDMNLDNVKVCNNPLTLKETMKLYKEAKMCVGMRFHSVVLQTILNGNNYIVDYTEPKKGKISGFLNQIGAYDFYADRYINLQESNSENFDFSSKSFQVKEDTLEQFESKYVQLIKNLICR